MIDTERRRRDQHKASEYGSLVALSGIVTPPNYIRCGMRMALAKQREPSVMDNPETNPNLFMTP